MNDELNPIDVARYIVEKTNRNLFLTGKAGTGKSTFIREVTEHTQKKFVVLAPTGVAALNVGGMTIHSFLKLDFAPYLPGISKPAIAVSNNTKSLIKNLDLIIIDEVSMVRADLLDKVDYVLRKVRENNQPFGGIQMLMVGDPLQLSPIAVPDEEEILRNAYSSFNFFDSKVLHDSDYLCISFDRVFRQEDEEFLGVLNRVRTGAVKDSDIDVLNSRFIRDFVPSQEDRYVTLVTHNDICDSINESKMAELTGSERTYVAKVSGGFPESDYPTYKELRLKEGARVMFVKNSSDHDYVNGSLGTVVGLNQDSIEVTLDDGRDVVVTRVTWDKNKYKFNVSEQDVETIPQGQFTQFPLKPAWAITIHKSQGLTFNQVIVDVKRAFADGQAYVALSRCRSLSGLVLRNKLARNALRVDRNASDFLLYEISNISVLADYIGYEPFQYEAKTRSQEDRLANPQIVKALKKWRLDESRAMNKPAFYVMGDKTLNAIALATPITLSQLRQVNGIGPQKEAKYGESIISIIQQFLDCDAEAFNDEHEYELEPINPDIVNALKKWRLNEAHAINKPAYCVIDNKTLNAIALAKPTTLGQLRQVKGIGPQKEDEYGESIISIIRQFVDCDSGICNEEPEIEPNPNQPRKKTYEISLDMFREGKTVAEIAQERDLTEGTIYGHLSRYVKSGELKLSDLVEDSVVELVRDCINELPEDAGVKDIYEALDEEVSYGEIRLILENIE